MRYRPRPRSLPFTALGGVPTESPLPRFTAPSDRSAPFDRIAADPSAHRVEFRPAGERVLIHCFGSGRREITISVFPAERGPSRVRASLPPQITEVLGRLADASGAVSSGAILDAVIVDRPGFRAVGPTGAPLADILVISDLPYLDGELLIGRPWSERRALLDELLAAVNVPSLLTATEIREIDGDFRLLSPKGFVVILRDLQSSYRAQRAR